MCKTNILRTKFELQREKQKDYRNVVVRQVVIIVLGLALSKFILPGADAIAAKLVITLLLVRSPLGIFVLGTCLENFTTNTYD